MTKKNIVLIGDPGGGKTVSFETLPGGTVNFNFDPGGWTSLDRLPNPNPKPGERKPKRLQHTPSLREWLTKGGKLEKDEILIVDYSTYATPLGVGMLSTFDAKVFQDFGLDLNDLEKQYLLYKERGVRHFTIDSLTGLQWYVLYGMVSLAGHGGKGTSQYTYGLAIEKMRSITDVCCHIPFDFILTTHVESEKDEVVGKICETILLYGKKLPGILLSMIDDIYYVSVSTATGSKEYRFETQPQMFLKIIRQRSFDNLPIKLIPNFSVIYKGVMSE